MCTINQTANKLKGGGFNVNLNCTKSGKPITISNKYGMFCKDMCDLKKCKENEKWLNQYIAKLLKKKQTPEQAHQAYLKAKKKVDAFKAKERAKERAKKKKLFDS